MSNEIEIRQSAFHSSQYVGRAVQRELDRVLPFEGLEGGYRPLKRIVVERVSGGWQLTVVHEKDRP